MMSRLFLLVKLDSTPVGGLESRFEASSCLKILNLSIEKKFQKKMIGSYLLKSLEDYISEFHRDINKLSGIAGNDSKAFYEKNGYTFDGVFHSKLIQV
jgi:GNAT superfamily N-acetyltransferase|tara:strand:- start:1238 stop:1531 length:294 start_codon:yes stop_codon:yes gene_type:complete